MRSPMRTSHAGFSVTGKSLLVLSMMLSSGCDLGEGVAAYLRGAKPEASTTNQESAAPGAPDSPASDPENGGKARAAADPAPRQLEPGKGSSARYAQAPAAAPDKTALSAKDSAAPAKGAPAQPAVAPLLPQGSVPQPPKQLPVAQAGLAPVPAPTPKPAAIPTTAKPVPALTASKPAADQPRGSVAVGGSAVTGGKVANASRVVAGMRAGFRSCYNRVLSDAPESSGNLRLRITVAASGAVSQVSAAPSGNIPGALVACVKAQASAASFSPPEGGTATITVPVTFVRQ